MNDPDKGSGQEWWDRMHAALEASADTAARIGAAASNSEDDEMDELEPDAPRVRVTVPLDGENGVHVMVPAPESTVADFWESTRDADLSLVSFGPAPGQWAYEARTVEDVERITQMMLDTLPKGVREYRAGGDGQHRGRRNGR